MDLLRRLQTMMVQVARLQPEGELPSGSRAHKPGMELSGPVLGLMWL